MQGIIFIILFIVSIILSVCLKNFIVLTNLKNGEDFNIKEYMHNFSFKNIDFKYALIFFILFVLIVKSYNVLNVIIYSLLFFSLILTFILDYKFMIIPDTASILILFSGIINLIFNFSRENIISSILGFIVGGVTLYIIDFIFEKITKTEGFGFGDMKLLASIGLMFGIKAVIVIMVLSIVLSAIVGIIYLVSNKILKKDNKKLIDSYLPLGPFIVVSTLIICVVPVQNIIFTVINITDQIVNKMI